MDFDWKKLVGGLAPTLGAALGGPMAGMAVKVIADAVLGKPGATESEVAAAIQAGNLTGEQIVALRTADQAFAVQMKQLDIDIMKVNQAADAAVLADVQSARSRQVETHDTMPQQIFYILTGIYVAQQAAMLLGAVPTDEFVRALITRGFGIIETGLIGAIGFFIGSSRGSKTSNETLARIAESPIVQPAASSTPPTTVIQNN